MLRMPEASRILSFLLSSFSPLPYSSFPPFSFSPFFLEPTRLFSALSRLRSCLFSRSRSRYSLACPALCHALSNYSINRRKRSAIRVIAKYESPKNFHSRIVEISYDEKLPIENLRLFFLFESFPKCVINLKLMSCYR